MKSKLICANFWGSNFQNFQGDAPDPPPQGPRALTTRLTWHPPKKTLLDPPLATDTIQLTSINTFDIRNKSMVWNKTGDGAVSNRHVHSLFPISRKTICGCSIYRSIFYFTHYPITVVNSHRMPHIFSVGFIPLHSTFVNLWKHFFLKLLTFCQH